MIYFNFRELQINSGDQIPAIFVLTVGLSLHYNNYSFNHLVDFRYKCFPLLDIPKILVRKRLIRRHTFSKKFEVWYRTQDPQSYIRNESFLRFNLPIAQKVQYIKLLSYRTINDQNNWIPTDYIENLAKIRSNELLTITQDKIYFKYEGTQ